jgi:hypothetical protein
MSKVRWCILDAKKFEAIGLLLLQRGGEGGNPAIVALEGAAKNQLLSHVGSETMKERGLAE